MTIIYAYICYIANFSAVYSLRNLVLKLNYLEFQTNCKQFLKVKFYKKNLLTALFIIMLFILCKIF